MKTITLINNNYYSWKIWWGIEIKFGGLTTLAQCHVHVMMYIVPHSINIFFEVTVKRHFSARVLFM